MRKYAVLALIVILALMMSGCALFSPAPPTKAILEGRVLVPERAVRQVGGQPLPGATVRVKDLEGNIVATTTTDANGYYRVEVPAGGPYIIEVVKGSIKVLRVSPQVEVGKTYDLGTADATSTAVALVFQAKVEAGEDPAEIDLDELAEDPKIKEELAQAIEEALAAGEDPTTAPEVTHLVDVIVSPPAPKPEPTPEPTPTYAVTFKVTPADATVVVKDSKGNVVTTTTPGVYKLAPGAYTYTVSKTGYVTQTGEFTVVNKDLTITVKLELVKYTLTLTGEGLTSVPEVGEIPANTSVTITVTPPEGKQIKTFTVNDEDKKGELVAADGTYIYTFTITGDTTIVVNYELPAPVYNKSKKTYYDTIQAAVNEASDNNTILVYPGNYEGKVTVKKGLTLKSVEEHAAVIDAKGADYAIDIQDADNVTIDGFKITGATNRGISVYGSSGFRKMNNTTITNNIIENNGTTTSGEGIYFHRLGDYNKVEGNTIKDNTFSGISLNSPASGSPATENEFNNNEIINNGNYGIYVQGYGFKNNNIEENIIKGHKKYGIYLGQAGIENTIIKNNIIEDNNKGGYSGAGTASGDGIFIGSGSSGVPTQENIIERNTITKHWNGIHFEGNKLYHYSNKIVANTIEFNSGNGIYFEESSQNTIEGNTIKNNNRNGVLLKTAAWSGVGSDNNIIKENKIVDNTEYGVQSDDKSDSNDATYNWWGSETGPGTTTNKVSNVLYAPWYIDEAMTTPSS